MNIRKIEKSELRNLIPLFKEVFTKHNVFQKQPEKQILRYMENVRGDWIVAEEDGQIVGALVVVVELKTDEHRRVRFKHIAVAKEHQRKGIGTALLKKAEEIAEKGKIEIHVAEGVSDPETVDFYKKNGYEVEGELKSHYRPGEKCTILGKVIETKVSSTSKI